jgi:hypothetical protein
MMVINNYLTQATAPYGSHSWWRLYVDEGDTGDTSTIVNNLEFRTSVGGSQAATGGTAFAGGAGTDGGSAPIVGDAFTGAGYQRTVDSAWWIGYHFASATSIVQMNLRGGGTRGRCVIKARLQYSDDSTTGSDGTWTDAFSIYDPVYGVNEDQAWPQDLTGASGYKAYRFVWTATPTANRTVLRELEMIKSAADYTSSAKVRCLQLSPEANICDNVAGTDATSLTVSAGTVTMSVATPVLIDSYTVTSGSNATRCPSAWTVDGTNDGTTWTNLSTKSGETFATADLKKTYAI